MKRLINITMTALFLLALGSNSMAAPSENRMELLSDPAAGSVYAVDDNFTMVTPKDESASGPRIVRHETAEPFAYRNAVPPYSDITMLPNGRFDLKAAGYGEVDLYEHLYAVCRKTNGTARFVIPVKYGQLKRLTQVSAVDAFSYIMTSRGGNSSWFMACDGPTRFVAEKEYNFGSKAETAFIRSGRGLEGVSYIKTAEEVAALAVYEERLVSAKSEETVLEETAVESATLKTDFIKVHNGVRYSALYKASGSRCGSVEVKKTASSGNTAAARVYDYEVCGYNAELKGERAVATEAGANRYAASLMEPVR